MEEQEVFRKIVDGWVLECALSMPSRHDLRKATTTITKKKKKKESMWRRGSQGDDL